MQTLTLAYPETEVILSVTEWWNGKNLFHTQDSGRPVYWRMLLRQPESKIIPSFL